MTSATIKLFLPHGDAKGLRTAEISNWTGKALAAPRTELVQLRRPRPFNYRELALPKLESCECYRQPSAGATWVKIAPMTCAL